MTYFERRQQLIEILSTEPGLRVNQLAERLRVSQGTIRNDLNALADQKIILRVHGGGAVIGENRNTYIDKGISSFLNRSRLNQEAKKQIGYRASQLVQDGDAILLDASTTVYHLAKFLIPKNNLRIVTNNIETARLLSQNPSHSVMLTGGILRSGKESVIGPWSEQILASICTSLAFLSGSGFTPEGGLTELDIFEAQFRQKAIQSTQRVIALVDSTKFGKIDLAPSIKSSQISLLFTDSNISSHWTQKMDEIGLSYTLCNVEQS